MKIILSIAIVMILSCKASIAQYQMSTSNKNEPYGQESSFQVNVYADAKPTVFNLSIRNPLKKTLKVQIMNKDLGWSVDTTISSESFDRRYSLIESEDGIYRIIVKNMKERVVKEIEMSTVVLRRLRVK